MNTTSSYYRNLIQTVLRNSESSDWNLAVTEWRIYDIEEDYTLSESCICGKENLRYLFTIRNNMNGNILYPIGSSCIKKFERTDMNEEADVLVQMFVLLHAVERKQFISLSSDLFSRKLLRHLYEHDAFVPTTYNHYDPYEDYQFMLNMFNKGDRRSEAQEKKASAIIMKSIRPYLQKQLQGKVHI